jgi:recombination protein RecA
MSRRLTAIRRSPGPREGLVDVVAALRRRYGDHIIRYGSATTCLDPAAEMPVLSTGSFGLDLLTCGLPRGAISEYADGEGAGKETLAHTALARCQRGGGLALLLDADGGSDPDALSAVGVALDALLLACPTTAQEAWHVLLALARCGALDLLLVTSLSGLLTLPGARARRLGWMLPRLHLALRGRRTALLLTNTALAGWDSRAPQRWETVGGPVTAQAAALRVALRQVGLRYDPHGVVVGLRTTATLVKHHGLPHGPPVSLELTAQGTHHALEMVTMGLLTGCLRATGLGLALEGDLLGRSPLRAAATLEEDPALAEELAAQVRDAWRGTALATTLIDGGAASR